jgi:hypothetical protein
MNTSDILTLVVFVSVLLTAGFIIYDSIKQKFSDKFPLVFSIKSERLKRYIYVGSDLSMKNFAFCKNYQKLSVEEKSYLVQYVSCLSSGDKTEYLSIEDFALQKESDLLLKSFNN